jgi:hypothetical protein
LFPTLTPNGIPHKVIWSFRKLLFSRIGEFDRYDLCGIIPPAIQEIREPE